MESQSYQVICAFDGHVRVVTASGTGSRTPTQTCPICIVIKGTWVNVIVMVSFFIFAGSQDLVTVDQLKHHEVLGIGMVRELKARIQSGDRGSGEVGEGSAA